MGKILRKVMPKSFILVPGYGAQGGKGKDLVHFFNEDGLGAIVNSSRGIIAAYKQEAYAKFGAENFRRRFPCSSRGNDRRYSGCADCSEIKLQKRGQICKSREFAVVAEQTEIASGIFSLWLADREHCEGGGSRSVRICVQQGQEPYASTPDQYL